MRKWTKRHKALTITATALLVLALATATTVKIRHDREIRETAQLVREDMAAGRAAFEADDFELALQKLSSAKTRIDEHSDALAELGRDLEETQSEITQYRQFLHIEKQNNLNLSTGTNPDRLLQTLSSYDVMEQADWADDLKLRRLTDKQQGRIRETTYKLLLWLAHYHTSNRISDKQAHLALEYLDKATSFHAATRAVHHIRARCFKKLGDKQTTGRNLGLEQSTPATIGLDHYIPGCLAANRGNKEEAIRQFRAALRLNPRHYFAMLLMGNLLSDLGRNKEAILAFSACVAMVPDDILARVNRAKKHLRLDQIDEALADFSDAIAANPNEYRRAFVYEHRSMVFLVLGRYDEALADLGRVIELAPEGEKRYTYRALLHLSLGNNELALADASKIIEVRPDSLAAWHWHGDIQMVVENYDAAAAAFSKSLELHHTHEVDYINLYYRSMAYIGLERYESALADVNRSLDLYPDLGLALWVRGHIHRRLGQLDKAAADARHMIQLDPRDASAHSSLGITHYLTGNYQAAATALRKSIELLGTDVGGADGAKFHLACTPSQMGHHYEAQRLLKRTVDQGSTGIIGPLKVRIVWETSHRC